MKDGVLLPISAPRGDEIRVVDGPDRGRSARIRGGDCCVGSAEDSDLVLSDDTIAAKQLRISRGEGGERGFLVRDLGGAAGVFVDGLRIVEAVVPAGTRIRVGGATIQLGEAVPQARQAAPAPAASAAASPASYHGAIGHGRAMQRIFQLLDRVAPSDVTVLIEGETGTGKTALARAVHQASRRADRPFHLLDCAALPPTLIESELFGHEKGAFTGADEARPGAFEAASGGTLLLDEVGDVPLELQSRFLRALEERRVCRIGAVASVGFDVRLIAATSRDLGQMVSAGRFRADLFYRLAVIRVRVPPLRDRPEEIEPLIRHFAGMMGRAGQPELTAAQWQALRAAPWPGNVRELRASLERALLLGDVGELLGVAPAPAGSAQAAAVDLSVPFRDAKRRVVDEFERAYVEALMQAAGGNVSEAARLAAMDRNYLRLLVSRHLRIGARSA